MEPPGVRACAKDQSVPRSETALPCPQMSPRAPLALLLGTACQFPQSHDTGFGSAPDVELTATTSTDAESTGSTSAGNADASSDSSSTSASPVDSDTSTDTSAHILDVGQSSEDTGDAPALGCQGKIDFLFVISNDGGMAELQPRLIASLPEFIATIQAKFADFDYHIMVTDSDNRWGNSFCDQDCIDAGSCKDIPDYPCDKVEQVQQCDKMLGAGSTFTAGWYAYNQPCVIAGDKRYLTRDQPDLATTFQCIAQVGSGSYGKTGDALAAAMSSQLSGVGGCNGGFLRKDALLMVTLIGPPDTANDPLCSSGTTEEWAQAIVDRKHGNIESVVMLDIGYPSLPWQDRLWQLTKMFKYHLITDIHDPSYGPAFEAGSDLALEACAGFVPPG